MGSPDFAVPALTALANHYPVVGVITQPDRPAGRGRILASPPIKMLADSLGLEVIQPTRLRTPENFEKLFSWNPDLIVVAAYGQILRQNVLDLSPFGCINVHASLLPRWRGAAPIQASILAGDATTGVSIMKMDAGVDTGAVLASAGTAITPTDTGGILTDRLAVMGAKLLLEVLPAYLDGNLFPVPQNNDLATYAPPLKKDDALLNFDQPAESLAHRVMAFNPAPGAFTLWNDQVLKIHRAHADPQLSLRPGSRGISGNLPVIGTPQGGLVIDELQPAGKKAMPGKIFLQGARNWESQ